MAQEAEEKEKATLIKTIVWNRAEARFKLHLPKGDSLTAEAAQMEELRKMLQELRRQRGDVEDWSTESGTGNEGFSQHGHSSAVETLQEEISLEELRWDWMQSEESMQELQGLLRGDVKDLSIIAFGAVGGLVSFSVTLRDLIHAMGEEE
eukprot:s601_g20.t2